MLRLRLGRLLFAPTLVPTLVLLPLLALLLALGRWQLGQAAEKRLLTAAFERGNAAAVPFAAVRPQSRYTRVELAGRYLPERQFLLDNMTHEGVAGYHVLTPLVTAGGTTVIVDRGWVAVGATRARPPDIAVAADARAVTGRLDELPRAGITLADASAGGWPRLVSFPRRAELETALGRPVWPMLVLLDPERPDGFVRAWRPRGLSAERHLGYAVQWFALAVALVIAYLVASLERHGARR